MGRARTLDEVRRISETNKAYWASMTPEVREERRRKASNRGRTFTTEDRLKQSAMMRGVWASRTPEQVFELGRLISERGAGRKPFTVEELEAHTRKALLWWELLTSERRTEVCAHMAEASRRSHGSGTHKSPREAMVKYWGGKTEEEKRQHYLDSFGKPDAIRRSGENWLEYYWSQLSDDEKAEYFRSRSCAHRQTLPEQDMEFWLSESQPNCWKYNGDCREGVVIGGKTPDFVNVNGLKVVIEVFSSYYHDVLFFPNKETPDELIEHYAKHGFRCWVFWDYEVYDGVLLRERLRGVG